MALALKFVAADMAAVDTWSDSSGNARHATQASAAARPVKTAAQTPNGGPSVLFDGTNDNMATAAFASPTAGVTIIALIKPTHATDTFRTMCCHAAAATWATPFARSMLRTNSSTSIGWEGAADSAATSANIAQEPVGFGPVASEGINTWFIIELVYDQTNIKVYRDGVETATKALSGLMTSSTQPFFLGARTGPGDYYQGHIAELRMYDTGLDGTARATARAEITATHITLATSPSKGSQAVPLLLS